MPWSYGDIVDVVAAAVNPEAPAFIHGERVIRWGDAAKRMNNLARALATRGAKPGDKIAFYLRNCPEYTEGVGASFLGRFTHVNINYRYKPDEVRYILDNSDAQTLIYASEFRDTVERDPRPASQHPDLYRSRRRRDRAVRGKLRNAGQRRRWRAARDQARSAGSALHLYRRHHRHAQGRDVAAWRIVHDLDEPARTHHRLQAVQSRRICQDGRRRGQRQPRASGLSHHARHRFHFGDHGHDGWRLCGDGRQSYARSARHLERGGAAQGAERRDRRRSLCQATARRARRGAWPLRSVQPC